MDETQQPVEEATTESAGYCIEIHVSPSGSIRVSVEPEQEEAAEGEAQPEGQEVKGIKGAIEVVMDIYANGGQVSNAMEGEDDFNAGFGDKTGQTPTKALAQKFA